LGVLYIRRQRWSLAQHHLECAHKVWQKMNDDHGLIRVYINLSLLNIELECPQKILECSEKALVKAQLTKEEMELGTIYMNMGIAYRLMGLSTKTEQYIWQAEAVFRRFTNVIGLASVKDNLGLVYLDQKRWSEAHQWLTSALEAWRKLGSEIGEFRVLIYLIEYALARGERQKALAQLDVLEQRLNQDRKEAFHFLRERITNYRRSLTENLSP
jgi:tetratricopeptide (TPR) repeat protein